MFVLHTFGTCHSWIESTNISWKIIAPLSLSVAEQKINDDPEWPKVLLSQVARVLDELY